MSPEENRKRLYMDGHSHDIHAHVFKIIFHVFKRTRHVDTVGIESGSRLPDSVRRSRHVPNDDAIMFMHYCFYTLNGWASHDTDISQLTHWQLILICSQLTHVPAMICRFIYTLITVWQRYWCKQHRARPLVRTKDIHSTGRCKYGMNVHVCAICV